MSYFSDIESFNFDDHDPLEVFDHGLRHDYLSHIIAIRGLLWRQGHADSQLEGQIEDSGEVARRARGEANVVAVDRHIELIQFSIYQSAAHSMAAVGMLAPLTESVFRGIFEGVGRKKPSGQLTRSIMSMVDDECLGLGEYMPDDLRQTLEALFLYRNKMFHHGFEWPPGQRQAFAERLCEWPDGWFDSATSDGEPWIFYMSSEFISHCIDTLEDVLRGLIRFQDGPGLKIWRCLEARDY